MFAPRNALRTPCTMTLRSWPLATAPSQYAAAAIAYALLGGGIDAALARSAAQHARRLEPVPPPVRGAPPAPAWPSLADGIGGTGSMVASGGADGATAAGGGGGGASSFSHPLQAPAPPATASATNRTDGENVCAFFMGGITTVAFA
jgi:hypothetical protein